MSSVKTQPKIRAKAKRPPPLVLATNSNRDSSASISIKRSPRFTFSRMMARHSNPVPFDVDPDSIRGFATEHLRPTDNLAVEVTSNTWAFVRLVRP